MTEQDGGARPGVSRPAADDTVTDPYDMARARRMAAYRAAEHPKYVRALDRHIAHVYGPEYVRRWAA